ncbi:hypothetical protein TEK04_05100 [Klenkia sp. LSe6-5]|uniref:Uncharacterized protein n=1 Tax=Klenkia sesuvii TaxID=3103137 RepID=A0ABU8DQH5_9ACTN
MSTPPGSSPATPSEQPAPLVEPSADGPGGPVDLGDQVAGLPVAEHVAVLTAEHDRLHRLLATIDQL